MQQPIQVPSQLCFASLHVSQASQRSAGPVCAPSRPVRRSFASLHRSCHFPQSHSLAYQPHRILATPRCPASVWVSMRGHEAHVSTDRTSHRAFERIRLENFWIVSSGDLASRDTRSEKRGVMRAVRQEG